MAKSRRSCDWCQNNRATLTVVRKERSEFRVCPSCVEMGLKIKYQIVGEER